MRMGVIRTYRRQIPGSTEVAIALTCDIIFDVHSACIGIIAIIAPSRG